MWTLLLDKATSEESWYFHETVYGWLLNMYGIYIAVNVTFHFCIVLAGLLFNIFYCVHVKAHNVSWEQF